MPLDRQSAFRDTIDESGRVTIPEKVRDFVGVNKGGTVDVVVHPAGEI